MFKVAIIDDEPIIVEGLSKTIDWGKWDARVVGFAYDGAEGIELIRKEKPDILISDIAMPNMNGLAMIAAVKSEFPYMQVSVLTGYREFDYAREAIHLGVTRFLLKPSKHDEIEEAITAMTDKLRNSGVMERESGKEEGQNDDTILENPASSFIVNNALKFIKDNYKEKLKLVDVADHIYVSQWHLSKLLNKHTGKNFSEILNGIRIEKAKELLKDPEYRIVDIAEAVGFLDLAHFSRVFKKTCGISANDYRNYR
ncbi:MAG: response regulator [Lachnospiraceae bacterium]|nr:response regulator [Lachnospiraceae bacterium]MCR5768989.1 response regulator [Lachnospiraceae bacterium]